MAQLRSIDSMPTCDWMHPRKIGHNTKAWKDNSGDFAIRYHSTVVVQFDAATQTLFVNTSGWFTNTTSERIRHGLAYVGLRLSNSDLKGKWRVMDYKGNAWTMRGNSLKLHRNAKGDWERVQ